MAKSLGGEIKQFYLTLGQYDFVAITEMPSNEATLQGNLETGSVGRVQTETLAAIPAETAIKFIAKIP